MTTHIIFLIFPFSIGTCFNTRIIIKEVPARACRAFRHQGRIRLYRAAITALVTLNTIISHQQLLYIATGAGVLVGTCFAALWACITGRFCKVEAIFTFGADGICAG